MCHWYSDICAVTCIIRIDLSHNLQTIDRYSTFGAQKLFAAGKRACWYDVTLRPVLTFFKKYLLCRGFQDGYPGLFIAVLTSYSNFAKYAKLWELQHTCRGTVGGKLWLNRKRPAVSCRCRSKRFFSAFEMLQRGWHERFVSGVLYVLRAENVA